MKEITKGIIALAIVVAVVAGVYAYETMEKSVLREGDFAEIYYIGYFENGTVFASTFEENVSYDTPFDSSQYNLTPLKIYFGKGIPSKLPNGWIYGDLGYIENLRISEIPGLYEGMKGMKKGEEKIIELEPEDAFGIAVKNGTIFNTSVIFNFKATFEIINVGGVTIDLKWLPREGQIITMPQYWYDIPVQQPYWIWENATEVVSFNETHVVLKTTPNKLENLTLYPWWENASEAGYNDTKIWITTTPPIGNFSISAFGYTIYGKVVEVTEDKIKIEYYAGNETIKDEVNRTIVFDRQIEMPRIFKGIQKVYVENDLRDYGYSFHRLAGKKVIFRVKLLRIYRVS
jgi:FKBP-type peptidyl-prolyl cis-trans isomerase 2